MRRALVLALLAAPAAAFDVTTIDPLGGSLGTEIVISGTGFGTGKPKVWIIADGETKKHPLKISSFSDTEIVAVVKKGLPGPSALNVQPKGADEPFAAMTFTLMAPAIDVVAPDSAAPGDEIVLTGQFFGLKKPKVDVSGFTCKVTSFDDGEVHALVSKKVFNGTHDVTLGNALGESTLAGVLVISGSTAKLGKDRIHGHIDGEPFEYKGGKLSTKVTYAEPNAFTLWVGMATVDGVGQNLILAPWYDPGVTPLPATFDGAPPYSVGLAGPLAWTDVFSASNHPTWITSAAGEPWEIVIEQQVGSQVQGHFSGQLSHNLLPDRFVDGSFVLTLGPPPPLP